MPPLPPPPAPVVGRFTGFVLGFVVFICISMIGGAGYLKYQLDRSEAVMASPDNALGSDQDMFDRLRRNWGYGGFLGAAQSYIGSRDAASFQQMKAEIKSADEIVAHLPDKTSAETRHELTAIASSFDAALKKMSGSAGEGNGDFGPSDLTPLYAAMPIIDARINAANAETRLAAQSKTQFWSMLLTLVSWGSLIIASACAASVYLTLRDKHSAPMRALAQSIQNMARGDMRTAIWGVERPDTIGELARAVDIARYQFSHLPDVSLLSDQGPVRMKFEGGSRSLFEAMMGAFSRDSEHIRAQSMSLNETVTRQHEAIAALSAKVENILRDIVTRGQNGDQQLRQAISEMVGGAEGLKNAHAHAADQLDRLIPHIQERAQGLAEITQITGKQISTTLHSLSVSEIGLKSNADAINNTLANITKTSADLGERLFGAINLLQASGKVLSETTEDLKLRMRGSMADAGVAPPTQVQEVSLAPLMNRLDLITAQIASLQGGASQPTPAATPEISLTPLFERLDLIAAQVATLQGKLDLPAKDVAQEAGIAVTLSALDQKISDLAMQRSAGNIQAAPEAKPQSLPMEIQKQLADQWFQMSAQIEASRADLIAALTVQIDRLESRLDGKSATSLSRTAADYSTQRQIEQQTHILSELVATLGVLDEHMQQIKTDMRAAGA